MELICTDLENRTPGRSVPSVGYFRPYPMNMNDCICAELHAAGYATGMVAIERLAGLHHDMQALHAQGRIDQRLGEYYLRECHDFTLRNRFPAARSLLIVAAPCHNIRTVFTREGQRIPLLLPGGYVLEERQRQRAENLIRDILGPDGHEIGRAQVPEKLLAARSGLGRYGRNNICYVPGMGSFHTLAAFWTDLACETDTWQEATMSAECQNCSACLKQCPTGAIVKDRMLIHAERCLTFLNELPGEFPDWVDPAWHHCLVGCLKCQQACPQNTAFADTVGETVEFTEQETTLLQNQPLEQFPETLNAKLRILGLMPYRSLLFRNLNAVLNNA